MSLVMNHFLIIQSAVDHMVWFKLLRETSQTATQNIPSSGLLTHPKFHSNFIAMRRHRLALRETNSLPIASSL